jgi:hypothetical protein
MKAAVTSGNRREITVEGFPPPRCGRECCCRPPRTARRHTEAQHHKARLALEDAFQIFKRFETLASPSCFFTQSLLC